MFEAHSHTFLSGWGKEEEGEEGGVEEEREGRKNWLLKATFAKQQSHHSIRIVGNALSGPCPDLLNDVHIL